MIVKEFPATVGADGHLLLSFRGPEPLPSLDPHSPYELSEDYVTALAEDGAGHLLVGHRQKGVEMLDPATGKHVAAKGSASPETDFVTALLPRADGSLWIAGYGAGLSRMPIVGTTTGGVFAQVADASLAALPTPEPPPTLAELSAMLARVKSLHGEMPAGSAVYLGEDWRTQGDWVGKYGTRLAVLCAAGSPFNHEIINDWTYKYDYDMGPDREPGDGVRHFITWLHTDDSRVLYDPVLGFRRESEWDDHGEVYPRNIVGPDLWISISVPEGVHRLTGYFVNKDAHGDGNNRLRDYLIEIRPGNTDTHKRTHSAALVTARVCGFWGGVYKSFAVFGPGKFYLHIARNNSVNTIVSGLMLDKLAGPPTPLEGAQCTFCKSLQYTRYITPPNSAKEDDGLIKAERIRRVWSNLDQLANQNLSPSMILSSRMLCYRALALSEDKIGSKRVHDKLLSWWRRSLPLETNEDRRVFLPAMAAIYAGEIAAYPAIKNIH